MRWFWGTLLFLAIIILLFFAVGLGAASYVEERRRAALTRALQQVTEALTTGQIPYFLDFGTALGHHRDGGVIFGDVDLDLGVDLSQTTRTAIEAALYPLRDGYALFRSDDLYKGIAKHNTYVTFDLYLYQPATAPSTASAGTTWLSYSKILCDKATIYPTVSRPFGGAEPSYDIPPFSVAVPALLPRFLTDRYGATYKTPRQWDKGVDDEGYTHSTWQLKTIEAAVVWRHLAWQPIPPKKYYTRLFV
jgi:hypothetical protein